MLTKQTTSIDEMLELLDIEGVRGLKFTDWNLFYMKRLLIRRPEITIFNGFDETLLSGLLYGAHGGIGTWYNLFPKLFLEIYQAVRENNITRALELQDTLLCFGDLAWEHGVRQIFELLMRERGLAPNCFRKPRQSLDKSERETILPELNKKIKEIEKIIGRYE